MFSPATKQQILQAIKHGDSITAQARINHVSRMTIHRLIHEQPSPPDLAGPACPVCQSTQTYRPHDTQPAYFCLSCTAQFTTNERQQ